MFHQKNHNLPGSRAIIMGPCSLVDAQLSEARNREKFKSSTRQFDSPPTTRQLVKMVCISKSFLQSLEMEEIKLEAWDARERRTGSGETIPRSKTPGRLRSLPLEASLSMMRGRRVLPQYECKEWLQGQD